MTTPEQAITRSRASPGFSGFASGLSDSMSPPSGAETVGKRPYRYVGIDWSDKEMRRAYDRDQQRAWRAKNRPKKRVRV